MLPRQLPLPHWPDINYHNAFMPLNDTRVDPKMKSIVVYREYIEASLFEEIVQNNIDLENYIFNLIESPHYYDNVERIFHLIEIWGGSAGRGLYQQRKNYNGFNWDNVSEKYRNIVNACLSIKNVDDDSLVNIYNDLDRNSINQIGVSYITKHVRFWTKRSLQDSMLPIYDNIMSCGNRRTTNGLYNVGANWSQMIYYWRDMRDKAQEENISLMTLERLLFNYFR